MSDTAGKGDSRDGGRWPSPCGSGLPPDVGQSHLTHRVRERENCE